MHYISIIFNYLTAVFIQLSSLCSCIACLFSSCIACLFSCFFLYLSLFYPIMSFTDIENFKNYISILDPSILLVSECNYYTEQEFNAQCLNNLQKGALNISCFHINIRSLNANHSKLIQLLTTLNHNFDAIVLSEIWAFNISFYKYLLKDYNFYYSLPVNSNIGGKQLYRESIITLLICKLVMQMRCCREHGNAQFCQRHP